MPRIEQHSLSYTQWRYVNMPVTSCPKDSNGNTVCEYESSAVCYSLLPGHHQSCQVAKDGYISCLDIKRLRSGTNTCKEGSYGVNKGSIWVQDGCDAEFHVCYTKEMPGSTVFTKTMQCGSEINQYNECGIRGPYLIKNVKRKYDDPNPACNEEISYGSYLNYIWVKNGCSDIFDIEYIKEAPTQPPSMISRTSTKSTTSKPIKPKTTVAPPVTMAPKTTPMFRPEVNGVINSTSVPPSTTTMTSTIITAPERTLNDGLVLITFGALLGVFLSLLIMTFVFCWLCRRRRFLNMKKVPSSSEHEDEKVSNFYEEIICQDGPLNYTAQSVSENDPFLEGPYSRKSGTGSSLEENNNPSALQNYFVLENQPPIPRIYPAHTRTPSGHSYFILEPQAQPQPSAPPLHYGPGEASTSSLRRQLSRDRQPSPDIIKSLSGPYHVQNIIPERQRDSDGYDIVGTFKQKYFLPQSKKVDNVGLNTFGSQTSDKGTQSTGLEEDNHTSC